VNFCFDTYYTDSDRNEHDIHVEYEYEPSEYNFAEGWTVIAAWSNDQVDILDCIPESEIAGLEDKCREHYQMVGEREQAMRKEELAEYLMELRNE